MWHYRLGRNEGSCKLVFRTGQSDYLARRLRDPPSRQESPVPSGLDDSLAPMGLGDRDLASPDWEHGAHHSYINVLEKMTAPGLDWLVTAVTPVEPSLDQR